MCVVLWGFDASRVKLPVVRTCWCCLLLSLLQREREHACLRAKRVACKEFGRRVCGGSVGRGMKDGVLRFGVPIVSVELGREV